MTQLIINTDRSSIESPYLAYSYSYPHKTAYRQLSTPLTLSEVWSKESLDALFLYIHIPFCEMRCGFCNLFTTANPQQSFESEYLAALTRQAEQLQPILQNAKFARFAIGGGTPTYLELSDINRLFDIAEKTFQVDLKNIPISVETSPLTATLEKLQLLYQRGVDRISIGVQSFIEAEAQAAGRSQKTAIVEQALNQIRQLNFATLNIDLIYGLPGQSVASWLYSLHCALAYQPEEIYLYPLYVRPLTGMGKQQKEWDDIRLKCYRAGRDLLMQSGYQQISMRMFQLDRVKTESAPRYCCQDDGMIGIGCGARSYTRSLHYSSEYAVASNSVRDILHEYVNRSDSDFQQVDYGFILNQYEQQRRFIIQSLLQTTGLDLIAYRNRFNVDLDEKRYSIDKLLDMGWIKVNNDLIQLTESGLEYSDQIGVWFYSMDVMKLMELYQLR